MNCGCFLYAERRRRPEQPPRNKGRGMVFDMDSDNHYQVIIGPWHALFKQFKTPACQVCFQPIVPGDQVDISFLDDGRYQVNHAACINEPELKAV